MINNFVFITIIINDNLQGSAIISFKYIFIMNPTEKIEL